MVTERETARIKMEELAGEGIKMPTREEIESDVLSLGQEVLETIRTKYFQNNEEALNIVGGYLADIIKKNNLELTSEQLATALQMVGSTYVPEIPNSVINMANVKLGAIPPVERGIELPTGRLVSIFRGPTPEERPRIRGRVVTATPAELVNALMDNTATLVARTIANEYFKNKVGKEISWDEYKDIMARAKKGDVSAEEYIIVAFDKRVVKTAPEEMRELLEKPQEETLNNVAANLLAPFTDVHYWASHILNYEVLAKNLETVGRITRLTREEFNQLQDLSLRFRQAVMTNPKRYELIKVHPADFLNFVNTLNRIRDLGQGKNWIYKGLNVFRNAWAGPLLSLPPIVATWIFQNVYTNTMFALMYGITPFHFLVNLLKKSPLDKKEQQRLLTETLGDLGMTPAIEPIVLESSAANQLKVALEKKLPNTFERIWNGMLLGSKINNRVEQYFRKNVAYTLMGRFINQPKMKEEILKTVIKREGLEGALAHINDFLGLTIPVEEFLTMPHFPEKQIVLEATRDELGRVLNHYMVSTPLERWVTVSLIPFWKFYRHALSLLLLFPFRHPRNAAYLYSLGNMIEERRELAEMAKRQKSLAHYFAVQAPDLLFFEPDTTVVKLDDLSFWQKYFTISLAPNDEGKPMVLSITQFFPYLFLSNLMSEDNPNIPALFASFLSTAHPLISFTRLATTGQTQIGGRLPQLGIATPTGISNINNLLSLFYPPYGITSSDTWAFWDSDRNLCYVYDFATGDVKVMDKMAFYYRALEAARKSGIIPLTASINSGMQYAADYLSKHDILIPTWLLPYIGYAPRSIKEKRKIKLSDMFPLIAHIIMPIEHYVRGEEPNLGEWWRGYYIPPAPRPEEGKVIKLGEPQNSWYWQRLNSYIERIGQRYGVDIEPLKKRIQDTLSKGGNLQR